MQSKAKMVEVEAKKLLRRYSQLDQVSEDLASAGLDSSNLILGVDFTECDEWTTKNPFKRRSLHHIGNGLNPYEQAISIIGKTLAAFDDENLIPCFGFGDSSTHDQDVFSFNPDESYCNGFEQVLSRYREITPNIQFAGPRSFAPIIEMAMTIVEKGGGEYRVLVVIVNGTVTRTIDSQHGRLSPQEQKTVDAIVEASKYPLSIILAGVGDGPWDMMKEFCNNIPTRAFDNFQFVNFTEIMAKNISFSRKEAAFALAAFMKIPSHYKAAIELHLLGSRKANAPMRIALPTPFYYSSSIDPSSTYDNQICAGVTLGRWDEYRHVWPISSDFEAVVCVTPCAWNLHQVAKAFLHKEEKFVLPLYSKNLREYASQEEHTWKTFMPYVRDSLVTIPPTYHGAVLLLSSSFLGYEVKYTTSPFDLGFKYSTNAPHSLVLSFGEAFEAFFPEMTHIAKFMLCYFLTLVLVFPLQPGVQILCMLLLISAPLFYFPELIQKSSGIGVACGSFKLPLIWFATLGAIGITLVCGIMTMIMVYLSWRLVSKGKSRVRVVDASFDGLSEVLEG